MTAAIEHLPRRAADVQDLLAVEQRLAALSAEDDLAVGQVNVDIDRHFPAYDEEWRPPADAIFKFFDPEGGGCWWGTGRTRPIEPIAAGEDVYHAEIVGVSPLFTLRFEDAVRLIPGPDWVPSLQWSPEAWVACLWRERQGLICSGEAAGAAHAVCLAAIRAHIDEMLEREF